MDTPAWRFWTDWMKEGRDLMPTPLIALVVQVYEHPPGTWVAEGIADPAFPELAMRVEAGSSHDAINTLLRYLHEPQYEEDAFLHLNPYGSEF